MKIYLSHNYSARHWLKKEIVPMLTREGYTVVSRWLDGGTGKDTVDARDDIEDINQSDVMIHFASQFGYNPGEGKYWEFGYAYASGIDCIVVGDNIYKMVFNQAVGVNRVKTPLELIELLRRLESEMIKCEMEEMG